MHFAYWAEAGGQDHAATSANARGQKLCNA